MFKLDGRQYKAVGSNYLYVGDVDVLEHGGTFLYASGCGVEYIQVLPDGDSNQLYLGYGYIDVDDLAVASDLVANGNYTYAERFETVENVRDELIEAVEYV